MVEIFKIERVNICNVEGAIEKLIEKMKSIVWHPNAIKEEELREVAYKIYKLKRDHEPAWDVTIIYYIDEGETCMIIDAYYVKILYKYLHKSAGFYAINYALASDKFNEEFGKYKDTWVLQRFVHNWFIPAVEYYISQNQNK